MNQLKNLITLKPNKSKASDNPLKEEVINTRITYFQTGYGDSKNANGSAPIFKTCLANLFQNFKDKCRLDNAGQNRLNRPFIEQKEKQTTELKKRETLKLIKEEEIKKIDAQLIKLEGDIAQVKNDPEQYGIDATKKPKAQFYIGLLILLPITLYLIVFYISASYSAFFKHFETTELTAAIFDANALSKAMNDGWLETIFISTIPFAFMGLGYLVHMYQKQKRTGWIKIIALYLTTFIFDSILAYQIEKKIYDIEKTLDSPPFDLSIAFNKVEFWGIIFAGFVVYIIWGLVFDFVMKEYENFDKIKCFIAKLREEITNLNKQKAKIADKINAIKQEITNIEGIIRELQSKIDGFIFPSRKYLAYFTEYNKGWDIAVMKELHLPKKEKDILINECHEIADLHLQEHGIDNEDYENTIYTN
ncbi:MAG: hypothetical protein ACEPOZ_20035 [Marinifilaceae bacterium]